MRKVEGGFRNNLNCIVTDKDNKLLKFHPLAPLTDNFVDWFINNYEVKLCVLYYEPYNMKRTGCKGCPFSIDLQEQLNMMSVYMPNELKQCEVIWQPVYNEYRRLNYRLKKYNQIRLL